MYKYILSITMTIKIAVPSITQKEIDDIIFHYNAMKPPDFGLLENLICREGGFKIAPKEAAMALPQHNNPFMNQYELEKRRNRELRWNSKRYLVSYCNIPAFLVEEELLLFKTMQFILGKENVSYYTSYGEAKMASPSVLEALLTGRSPKRNSIAHSPPQPQKRVGRIFPI